VDLDDDDDDEEYEKKVMTIAHGELCIGCTACSKICPKKCYTHGAVEV
jgi:formate hydrogenlyase subunit 6/NADH:ubiquinone oxidoreductase subunit I